MNLFKNVAMFSAELPGIEQMHEHLTELQFRPIGENFMSSAGFVHNGITGELVTPFEGGFSFTVRYDEKILPGSAVTQAVREAKKLLEQDDRELTAEEAGELREKIYGDMVKKAIPKAPVHLNCFYHADSNYLIIPTTSKQLSQTVMRLLVQAVGSIKTNTIHVDNVKGGLTTRLKQFLGMEKVPTGEEPFGNFKAGDSVVLRKEKDKLVVDVGNLMSASGGLRESLESGMSAESMTLTGHGVHFKLTNDFRLKQVSFTEELDEDERTERYGEAADDAHVWRIEASIQMLLMVAVVRDLCEMFSYKPPIKGTPPEDFGGKLADAVIESDDKLRPEALNYVRDNQRASVSALQRHLGVGFNRAARLMDWLVETGAVSEMDEYGRRQVLAKPLQTDIEDFTGKTGEEQ